MKPSTTHKLVQRNILCRRDKRQNESPARRLAIVAPRREPTACRTRPNNFRLDGGRKNVSNSHKQSRREEHVLAEEQERAWLNARRIFGEIEMANALAAAK